MIYDLGWYCLFADRHEEGLAVCLETLEMSPGYGWAKSCEFQAYVSLGRWEDALYAIGVAKLYAALDEHDAALDWIERALAKEDPWVVFLHGDPSFDNLHDDPRFDALLERVGVLRYARRTKL